MRSGPVIVEGEEPVTRVEVVACLPGQGRLKVRDKYEGYVGDDDGKDCKHKSDTDHGAADISADEP